MVEQVVAEYVRGALDPTEPAEGDQRRGMTGTRSLREARRDLIGALVERAVVAAGRGRDRITVTPEDRGRLAGPSSLQGTDAEARR